MIKKLTPEQESKFSYYVKKWTDIGLSTEPANRELAEEGIKKSYLIAGLDIPEKIIWCQSPLGMFLTKYVLSNLKKILKTSNITLEASVRDSVFGQHDSAISAFFDFFEKELNLVSQTEKWLGNKIIAENAGWWLPYKNICFISERHSICKRDERGRIHSLDGAAIQYPDGWSIYAIHGVRVKEYIISNPEKITVSDIELEKNTEVRRIMIEKFGHDRYLKESGAKLVDKDQYGELIEEKSIQMMSLFAWLKL